MSPVGKRLGFGVGVALVSAGVGVGGVYLYRNTQTVSAERRGCIDGLRRSVLALDSDLKRFALENRYGMQNQYDALVRASGAIAQDVARWEEEVLAAMPRQPAIARAFEHLRAEIKTQRSRIEAFKSKNSVLKNSLRYLPKSSMELAEVLGSERAYAGLRAVADRVVRSTFMFGAFRGTEDEERLERSLGDLERAMNELERAKPRGRNHRQRSALSPTLARKKASLVLLHGRVCAREMGAVAQLLGDLRASPLAELADQVDAAYVLSVSALDRRAAGFRAGLYALTGALGCLLVALAYFLRRLYATLEDKVTERTASLREAHVSLSALYASNKLVLENVNEGLLTLDSTGELSPEVSAAALRWFEAPAEGETAQVWLGRRDPTFGAYLDLGLDALRDDLMPREVTIESLPKTLGVGDRTYAVRYTPVEGEDFRLLLSIEDVTEKLAREEDERRQADVIRLVQRIGQDARGTFEFIEEMGALLQRLQKTDDVAASKRLVHTAKGNAGIYGLRAFAQLCHELERAMEEGTRALTQGEWATLERDWARIRAEVAPFAPTARTGVELPSTAIVDLRSAVTHGASSEALLRIIDGWSKEDLEARLRRLEHYLRGLAERLGRAPPVVTLSAPGIQLDPERWKAFWGASVHLIRNMIDHGIESPDERKAAGKPEQGAIELSGRIVGEHLALVFADDGRGIDWARIRAKAEARGLPAQTEKELTEALFSDGISSRDDVTETSGRGVGMSAVRAEAEALGAMIDIESDPGKGTRVRFRFPLEQGGIDVSPPLPRAS